MKNSGASPGQVFRQAVRDGLDPITRIRMVRAVFSLSLAQAKEVISQAEEGTSLDEQQERIADTILEPTGKRLP